MSDLRTQAQQQHPIIDETAATFVWLGEDPPLLIGDFNNYGNSAPPIALAATAPGIWSYRLPLPHDAYVEYAFIRPGFTTVETAERVADPLNPERKIWSGSPMGSSNHWLRMPGSQPSPYATPLGSTIAGRLTKHQVAHPRFVAGGQRTVHLYQPPVTVPVPLVLVWDGQDYLDRGQLIGSLENLMAAGLVPPLALAMINHGDQARFLEYNCSDTTLAYVTQRVLPLARQELRLVETPGAFGVMGASMGGLMSLYTGMRLPQIFGKVLCESGAFGHLLGDMPSVVEDLVRALPRRDLRIWMDAGTLEWLYEPNLHMYALLRERGYAVTQSIFNAGHTYTAWRDSYWRGLIHLFGQP